MTGIAEELQRAADILTDAGVEEPHREASSLMAFALGRDRAFIITHPDYHPTPEEQRIFDSALERRARREPFQYIVGKKEFYGLEFAVSPDVLIPRPETEGIVERAISELREIEHPRFCEIGIGSGCIAVSILANLTRASAIGADISEKALAIAALNARANKVFSRLELTKSNVFSAISQEKFDAIVSNPPYVPAKDIEHLQAEVRDFEPHIALTDGGEGVGIIGRIVGQAPAYLKQNGVLLIEIGFDQAERVLEMFDPEIWYGAEVIYDLQGIPRIILARRR